MTGVSNDPRLINLLESYRQAPIEYQATAYWQTYEAEILDTLDRLDVDQLRSGRYKVLSTFGFNDTQYAWQGKSPGLQQSLLKLLTRLFSDKRDLAPYKMKISDIRQAAMQHCTLMAELTDTPAPDTVEVSRFGNPQDLFEIDGKAYTMPFLNNYIRACFANRHVRFTGSECVVELGTGSGYQVEVLKKLYPQLTVLCLDLPAQLYLCETYLTQALGADNITSAETTRHWSDLSAVQPGKVHFFGNWQFPLLRDRPIELFWNAASFGEMEPAVVQNYLDQVAPQADWIYLLQARQGKETSGKRHVESATALADYDRMLASHELIEERDAWHAHRKLSASGGYFEGVWKRR